MLPEDVSFHSLHSQYDAHLRCMILLEQGETGQALSIAERALQGGLSLRQRKIFEAARVAAKLKDMDFAHALDDLKTLPESPATKILRLHAHAGARHVNEVRPTVIRRRKNTRLRPDLKTEDRTRVSYGRRRHVEDSNKRGERRHRQRRNRHAPGCIRHTSRNCPGMMGIARLDNRSQLSWSLFLLPEKTKKSLQFSLVILYYYAIADKGNFQSPARMENLDANAR